MVEQESTNKIWHERLEDILGVEKIYKFSGWGIPEITIEKVEPAEKVDYIVSIDSNSIMENPVTSFGLSKEKELVYIGFKPVFPRKMPIFDNAVTQSIAEQLNDKFPTVEFPVADLNDVVRENLKGISERLVDYIEEEIEHRQRQQEVYKQIESK